VPATDPNSSAAARATAAPLATAAALATATPTPPTEALPRPSWLAANESPESGAIMAPVAPVVPVRRPATPGSNTRWGIALVVTALAVGVGAAAFFLLSAGSATSGLVRYVPLNSVAYVEIRLDQPGDQHQNAANVMSHFPGFLDQSDLTLKIDTALDQAIGNASGNKDDYSTQIKPWLGDSIAVAVSPPATTGTGSEPGGIVLVDTKDAAAAQAWAAKILGPGTSTETYGGVPLTVVDQSGQRGVYGVDGTVLIVGSEDAAKAAIDTQGVGTFGGGANFETAVAATTGDHLAFAYIDLQGLVSSVTAAAPGASALTAVTDQLPAWAAVTVRAESDGVSLTTVYPATTATAATTNNISSIAPRLPATTLAVIEEHSLGTVIKNAIASGESQSQSSGGPSASALNDALKPVGGIDGLIGWMGDGAIVAVGGGVMPSVGLVIEAKTADAAGTEITQIKNLVALAGSATTITSHDETYNGTTITIIDLGDASQLLGTAEPQIAGLVTGRIEIAIAQKDNLVLAGVGDAFIKAVLDTKAGSSLADQGQYQEAIKAVGSSNTAQVYADVASIVTLADSMLPATTKASFDLNVKPYLTPFKAVAAAGMVGDPSRATIIVLIK
jgi:hypothetical protein